MILIVVVVVIIPVTNDVILTTDCHHHNNWRVRRRPLRRAVDIILIFAGIAIISVAILADTRDTDALAAGPACRDDRDLHAYSPTRTLARTHARTHTHLHARTRARPRAQAHTHTHARARARLGAVAREQVGARQVVEAARAVAPPEPGDVAGQGVLPRPRSRDHAPHLHLRFTHSLHRRV